MSLQSPGHRETINKVKIRGMFGTPATRSAGSLQQHSVLHHLQKRTIQDRSPRLASHCLLGRELIILGSAVGLITVMTS
jgi:hypothetical protein